MKPAATLATAVTGAAIAGGLFAPPATAAAGPVSLPLNYTCAFPLIGPQPMAVRISGDIPATLNVGDRTPAIAVDAVASVSAQDTKGLKAMLADTLSGKAVAAATLTSPQGTLPLSVPTTLETATIPASGAFEVTAHGGTPGIGFTRPGTATITVGDLVLTLTPKDAGGRYTGLGTFESECHQDPGQNAALATISVVQPSTAYSYRVSGSTSIKAGGGSFPLTGTLGGTAAAGGFTGDLALDPADGTLRLLGVVPVATRLAFTPYGRTTGTLTGGTAALTSAQTVGVASARLFGVPLAVGAACRTAAPATVPLAAAAFDPAAGGTVTGTYTLPALAGCGLFTGALSGAAAGDGNTLTLSLAPLGTS